MIAVVIPTCDHHFNPPDYGTIPVIVVIDKNRRGFAASCNIGIAEAHSKGHSWVLVCNDDVDLSLSDLKEVLSKINEHTGAIAPIIIDERGFKQTGIFVSRWGRVRLIQSNETIAPDAVSGACMLVPSWARFNSQYLHGFEDIALCSLLRKRNKEIFVCRSAQCVHKGGGTLAHNTRLWFARSVYGQLLFFSSPPLSGLILGFGFLQARGSLDHMKGVWEGYLLWKNQRNSKAT